jgi:uncharacterized protein (TIGR03437 family)
VAAHKFLALALLSAWTAIAADSSFLLGVDYNEWLTHGRVSPSVTQIATDSSGDLYIEWTYGSSFESASWVTKLSADGKTRLWENQLGFVTTTMAVDPSGGVYVIPVVQPSDTSIYVVKLSADGTGVLWKAPVGFASSTQLFPGQWPPVLAADSQGRAYVAAYGASNSGEVVRLNAAGSAVDYTAQVAGVPTSIAVDESGAAFVAGLAGVANAEQFLARFAPDGSAGFYSTLAQQTSSPTIALDANGDVFLFGGGLLQRVDSAGTITLSTTVALGGGFAVDAAGNAYITEVVANQLYPAKNSIATCAPPIQTQPEAIEAYSVLLSVVAPDGSLLQTTYVPGAGSSYQVGIGSGPLVATGSNSTVFVATTSGANFAPTQAGPFPAGSLGSNILLSLSPNANAQLQPLACVGNAASYGTGPIAPGEMVTLIGSGLGPQLGIPLYATPQNPLPKQAGNVEVTFDGTPAPLLWVQDAQINAIVPWALTPGQTTQICVSYNGTPTNCLTWPVAQTAPAVFTMADGYAYALNQDGTINSAANPAPVGSIVAVWATGLGPITPMQADGALVGLPLSDNVLAAGVDQWWVIPGPPFGGKQTGTTPFVVTYAGPAPYLIAGESQINFQIGTTPGVPGAFSVTLPSTQSPFFQIHVAGE